MPERHAPSGASEHARAIFAAFDAKNVEALSAFMTDDVRLQLTNQEVVVGKVDFARSLQSFFDSVAGFHHRVLDVWHDGDALIAELEVHYRARLDGTELNLPAATCSGCGTDRSPTTASGDARSPDRSGCSRRTCSQAKGAG